MFMRRRGSTVKTDESGETPDVPLNWRRLLSYLKPYWRQMVVAFLALIVSSALSLVFPAVIQQVVDTMAQDVPAIPLFQVKANVAARSNVQGLTVPPTEFIDFSTVYLAQ